MTTDKGSDMTRAITTLVLSSRPEEGDRLGTLTSQRIDAVLTSEQVLRRAKRSPHVSVVIIADDVSMDIATHVAEELRVSDPTLAIILVRNRLDVALVARAMSAGIREAIRTNDVAGLLGALERHTRLVSAMRQGTSGSTDTSSPGRTYLVYSAKGGVGKTTVAINLAAALAERDGARVLVVDLDLQFGDVGIVLGLQNESRNIGLLADVTGDLTREDVARSLVRFQDKFDVLLAPDSPDKADRLSGDLVTRLLTLVRDDYDYVVVDSPPAFTDEILAAFDVTDVQILVTTPDLPSMKNLVVATETLNKIGLNEAPRVGLINRFPPDSGLGKKSLESGVEKVTEAASVATIPELAAIATSSVNGGCAYYAPFSAKVRKAFNALAAMAYESARR